MAKLLSGTRIYGNATVDTNLIISGSTVSSNVSTGALTVAGGAGIAGNVFTGNTFADGYFYSNGVPFTSGGTGAQPWTVKTANYTAVNGDRILANTLAIGTFTITLPASPTTGSYIQISDAGNLAITPVTVGRNGSTIENFTDDVNLTITSTTYEFIYDGATWEVTATTGARGPAGTGSAISISDEGSLLTNAATSIDFVGSGVTANVTGTNVTVTISGGGSGTPGGSNTQVQFNDSGSFGGNAAFTFTKTTGNLTATNVIVGNTTTGGVFANTVTFNGTAANVIAMVFNSANVSIDFILR